MPIYNQKKDIKTKYSCTIYSMLNIVKYDYGIEVKDSMILSIVDYMTKIGALLPKGAEFSIIYPAFAKMVELQTGLKLEVKQGFITRGLDKVSTWGLCARKLSSLSVELARDDGFLSIEDMQKMATSKVKFSGHNHTIKQSNKNASWKIIESWGGFIYTTSLEVLKEGIKLGLYYDKARTFIPADERTTKIQKECVRLAKEKKRFLTYEEFEEVKNLIKQ